MNRETRIVEILLKSELIDDLQLRAARAHQDQWGGAIAHAIVEKGFATEENVVAVLAEGFKVPRLDLSNLKKDSATLAKLDADFAAKLTVFPVNLKDNGKTLVLAVTNPVDLELIDQVSKRARIRVEVGIAGANEIHRAIDRHYRDKIEAEPVVRRAPLVRKESVIDASLETEPRNRPAPSALMWNDETLKRLDTLSINQRKVEKILEVLQELLLDKGIQSRH